MTTPIDRRQFLKASAAGLLIAWTGSCSDEMIHESDVLVIGAGIAGLAAAKELRRHGRTVIVIEGRERLGGRIFTSNALGSPLDLGAAWIHGISDNHLMTTATELQLRTKQTDWENLTVFDRDGTPFSQSVFDEMGDRLDHYVTRAFERGAKLDESASLGGLVAEEISADILSGEERRMLDWQVEFLENDYADALGRVSAYVSTDEDFRGKDAVLLEGYGGLVEAVAAGLDVRLSHRCLSIDYQASPVHVGTDRGDFWADRVLVTVPLGVLKRSVQSPSEGITFLPGLPAEKIGAVGRLGMGVMNKVFLRFERAFWPLDVDGFGSVAGSRGEFSLLVAANRWTPLPILGALSVGDPARNLENLSDKAIVSRLMATLRRLFGAAIPEPTGYVVTRWSSDPWSFGAYSFCAVGMKQGDRELLASPVGGRLFFAGEATHATRSAMVDGAYDSGIRAARELVG